MIKSKFSVVLVSLIFMSLTSCSDKTSSDSDVINTDYINRDNMSNSSTSNNSHDINFGNNTNTYTPDSTANNSDKPSEDSSALETNPQGYSKISGGNIGSTWSGD